MTDDIIIPPNTKAIPLSKGKYAIVDDEDYEELNKYKWTYHKNGYAHRCEYLGRKDKKPIHKIILMHRLVMGTPKGMHTDHINGNKLDNRRCNLRICTTIQNQHNQKITDRKGTSKYKGVSWNKGMNKWIATIVVDKKQLRLGYYISEEDAAEVYNQAAKKYFGEFAKINLLKG